MPRLDQTSLFAAGTSGRESGFRKGVDGGTIKNNPEDHASAQVMANVYREYRGPMELGANTFHEYHRAALGRSQPSEMEMERELRRQLTNSEVRHTPDGSASIQMLMRIKTTDGRQYEHDSTPPQLLKGVVPNSMAGSGVSGPPEDLIFHSIASALSHRFHKQAQELRRAMRLVARMARHYDVASDTGEIVIADPGIAASTMAHGRFGFMVSEIKEVSGIAVASGPDPNSAPGSGSGNSDPV